MKTDFCAEGEAMQKGGCWGNHRKCQGGEMRGHTDIQMGLLGRGSKLRTLKQKVKETETRKKNQLINTLPPVMHSVKTKQNSSKVKKKMAKGDIRVGGIL